MATQTLPRVSSRNPITELALRLEASPATDRKRRIASPFWREMLTPPAKVPTHSAPLRSVSSDQMELLFSPEELLGSNLLWMKRRVAKSR